MSDKKESSNDLLSMEPVELQEYIMSNYSIIIPVSVETAEDLKAASVIISTAYSNYSFLTSMRQMAKIQKRMLKRQKESSAEIEKMLMREEIFETEAGKAKHAYDTVSRMVTIKQMINQEMKMV